MTDSIGRRIALVLKGYPRLSETFIAQEILELERAGFEISIISLRHPTDKHTHPVHAEISAPRYYLPEYVFDEPSRVIRAKFNCMTKPGFWRLIPIFLKDLVRDPTPNRVRRVCQAMVMAHEYAHLADHIYVHFLHTPGSVARYAAIISGKRFSISAHAKDIWTIPEWEIREKLADCDWLVTCTRGGALYLSSLAPEDRVHLVYHGLDLGRFPSPSGDGKPSKSKRGQSPIRLLTVGRAVAKKGINVLLDALAIMPDDIDWHWTHIGGGPLKEAFQQRVRELEMQDRCEFRGALPQSDVLEAYRNCDVFVLPSRIDDSGDRDGLPNVIVEAQSQGLPVISTNVSGIPELIADQVNGLLVEPDDPDGLKEAIVSLAKNRKLASEMGKAGEKRVRTEFSHKQTIGKLVELLNSSLGVDQ